MPLPDDLRASLKTIRLHMLDLHKLLLDREREKYEQQNGPVKSSGDYLSLVLNNAQFEWLRQMSGVIVELDELVSIRTKSGPDEAAATVDALRSLLTLKTDGTDFQRRYDEAVQESPDILIAHCKAENLLSVNSKPS